jgi:hypothetical protein
MQTWTPAAIHGGHPWRFCFCSFAKLHRGWGLYFCEAQLKTQNGFAVLRRHPWRRIHGVFLALL